MVRPPFTASVFVFSAVALLCRGEVLWAHPGADAALAHFNEAIDRHPDEQALYIQRGIANSNNHQYPQARDDFQRAAQLGDPILVAFDFGVLYYRMGDFAAARRYFDQFLQAFPDHAPCLEYRARLLRDAGDYKAAVADFRRVFALQQRPNPGHYIAVARMLLAVEGEGVNEALAILDAGNAKLGITPQLQRYATELELARGQPGRAVQRLRTLQTALGDSPGWKTDMAELMLQTGQRQQACVLLDTAAIQLDGLRNTPAREELRDRIQRLRTPLAGTSSGPLC